MAALAVEETSISLDDLYHMTAYIYGEKSAGRSPESTFAHFVEVCGMLAALDKRKPIGEVNLDDALCKALGWFFPLLAQFRVRSVSSLIFRKFPNVCPYCRRAPHDEMQCKNVVGAQPGIVAHETLRALARTNSTAMPHSLNEWQAMFQKIYPRTANDTPGRSALGLMEEIGELAEAIRVFDRHPQYFAGEAADVFSYIMGLANQHTIKARQDHGRLFSFETEYLQRYPGRCVQCGYDSCRCPHIPQATVGRMAKELAIDKKEKLFDGVRLARSDAADLSRRIFEELGGFRGLIEKSIPLDRGQTIVALVEATLELAEQLDSDFPEYAESLRRNAMRLIQSATQAGEKQHSLAAEQTILGLFETLSRAKLAGSTDVDQFERRFATNLTPRSPRPILLILSSPKDRPRLATDSEYRHINSIVRQAPGKDRLSLTTCPAATIDDVRRTLLQEKFTIMHFAGHGEDSGLQLSNDSSMSTVWSYSSLAEYASTFGIECLVLNACNTDAINATVSRPLTIAMHEEIDDASAIRFAQGFYEALATGHNYTFSFGEGLRAVRSVGLEISAQLFEQSIGG